MKKVVGILAVALLATTASAATNIAITGPGGVASYEPAVGEVFEITVTITTDVPLTAWGGTFTGPGLVQASILDVNAIFGNKIANYADTAQDFGPPLGINYTSSVGWDIVAGSAPVEWPAGPLAGTVVGTAAANVGTGATSGIALKAMVEATGELGMIMLDGAYAGDLDFNNVGPTVDGLMITPEPASLMLLLAGLPLLRRRR